MDTPRTTSGIEVRIKNRVIEREAGNLEDVLTVFGVGGTDCSVRMADTEDS